MIKSYNIPYSPHITRFLEKLKHQFPGLNDQKISKKLYVSLKTKPTKEVEECLQPQTLIDMMQKVTKEIRTKLRDTVTDFTGSFTNELSLPSELMVFLNLLLFGKSWDEFGFSLPVKVIAQIILYNIKSRVRSNSTSTHQRHNMERESPFLLYVGLKIYSVTRSRIVIDILHAHGLCISYEGMLRVTQGLSEATLNLFELAEAVIPGNLCTGLFTIGAKDNIDKNSRCAISKSHYHGTSLSLFQFPSTVIFGEERYYEKFVKVSSADSRKMRELPSFSTEFEEVKDPPAKIFFTSFNSKHSR